MDIVLFEKGELVVPELFKKDGENTWRRFVEFFTAQISNDNTRRTYLQAANQFLVFLDRHGFSLKTASPVLIASYIRGLSKSPASINVHLAAIRVLYDFLVVGGEIPHNPARSVKGIKHIVRKGKTPVLTAAETRQLLDSIEPDSVIGARDRALIGVMVFSFARIGAVTNLQFDDYYHIGKRSYFRLTEKGGRYHELPAHHKAQEYLDFYIGLAKIKDGWMFRSCKGRNAVLSDQQLSPRNALHMIKRRSIAADISDRITCHTFRATGITTFLKNGGSLEQAQYIAAHGSPMTTKLYDRRQEEASLDEIERIVI